MNSTPTAMPSLLHSWKQCLNYRNLNCNHITATFQSHTPYSLKLYNVNKKKSSQHVTKYEVLLCKKQIGYRVHWWRGVRYKYMAWSSPSHQYISFEVMIAQLYTEEWWKNGEIILQGPLSFLQRSTFYMHSYRWQQYH